MHEKGQNFPFKSMIEKVGRIDAIHQQQKDFCWFYHQESFSFSCLINCKVFCCSLKTGFSQTFLSKSILMAKEHINWIFLYKLNTKKKTLLFAVIEFHQIIDNFFPPTLASTYTRLQFWLFSVWRIITTECLIV